MEKKYYWLKLKRDFFKRHDMRIIEAMPNGEKYLLFYLKLLVESIDHFGNLRFSDTIPYNDQMLSTITNTDIDTVRSACKLLIDLGLMEMIENGTLFMTQIEALIGTESSWAEKKRLYREGITDTRTLSGQCPHNVLSLSDKSKSIEIRDKSKNKSDKTQTNTDDIFDDFYKAYPRKDNKTDARKAFASLLKSGTTLETIMQRLETYKRKLSAEHTEAKYIRNPARFLRTLDDFEETRPSAVSTPSILCSCGGSYNPGGFCRSCGAERP